MAIRSLKIIAIRSLEIMAIHSLTIGANNPSFPSN
jgi:hypothetical protein